MARGNNDSAEQPRSTFRTAGGSIMKFQHPYLAGQISGASPVDTIDFSSSVKLKGTFFTATPAQDSAVQEVTVDGSVITITNHLTNGVISVPAMPTTGLVGTGDFIACCQLIQVSKDSVGGNLYYTEFIGDKAITTMYYGVAVQNVPQKIAMGDAVPVYDVKLAYAGWIQGVSSNSTLNEKGIWASGNLEGIQGVYTGTEIDTGTEAMSASNVIISDTDNIAFSSSDGAVDNSSEVASTLDDSFTTVSGSVETFD